MKTPHFFQVGQHNRHLPLCPGILISLLDIMRLFPICDIESLLYRIRTYYKKDTDWQSGKVLSKKRAEYIRKDLHRYIYTFVEWEWLKAWNRLGDLCNFLLWGNDSGVHKRRFPSKEFTVLVNKGLRELENAIDSELDARCFVMVDEHKRHFLEDEKLFGKDIHKNASAEINSEIKSAGNCLGFDLRNAAAFHLMRVAEFGLRQLAQHRPSINQPALAYILAAKRPIEEATWKMVYEAIDTEIKARKNAGTISTNEQEFYSHLMIQIRSFQFAWRDPIMHARFERPHEVEDMGDAIEKFMRELMAGGVPLK